MDQSSRLDAGIPRQGRNCGHPATGSLIAANIDSRRRSAWGYFLDTGPVFAARPGTGGFENAVPSGKKSGFAKHCRHGAA
jgi:hypothetical protein